MPAPMTNPKSSGPLCSECAPSPTERGSTVLRPTNELQLTLMSGSTPIMSAPFFDPSRLDLGQKVGGILALARSEAAISRNHLDGRNSAGMTMQALGIGLGGR
jgi:hypothetical protein